MSGASTAREDARRAITPMLLISFVILVLVGATPPAVAADGPTIGNLQTFLVGKVTGTVTTDSPYVRVQLSSSGIMSGALPVTNGSASFNLPTWGFTTYTVRAVGCSSTDPLDCDTPVTESATIRARDASGRFSLLSDRTVPNGQRPRISVTDSQGGGVLRVRWIPDDAGARTAQQDVNRSGISYLDFLASTDIDGDGVGDTSQVDDGFGNLVLWRCAGPADPNQCRVESSDFEGTHPISVGIEVDHSVWSTGHMTPDTIAAAPTTLGLPITLSDPGAYHLAWKVVQSRNQAVVMASGSQDFTASGSTADVSISVNQLDEGTYVVLADLTRQSDRGPAFASRVATTRGGTPPTFDVDQDAPVGAILVSTYEDLFPARDGYRDQTGFTLRNQHEAWTDVQLQVQRDSDFAIVHNQDLGDVTPSPEAATSTAGGTVPFAPWDGRDDAGGSVVPAGSYTAIASFRDVFGNRAVVRTGLWVDSRRLVTHHWVRTVPATSWSSSHTGRCAALRIPSTHRWSGSVALASSFLTHCHKKAGRGAAATYSATLPAITPVYTLHGPLLANPGRYGGVSVRQYGSASVGRTHRHSVATTRWIDAGGRIGAAHLLGAAVGWRAMSSSSVANLARGGRVVRWTTATSGKSSYDLGNQQVVLTYTNLE